MIIFQIGIFTAIIVYSSNIGIVQSERIMRQDPSIVATAEKMDAIIRRMDQLEHSVSTLRAQCACETEKFLNAESTAKVNARPSSSIASRCSQQTLKICESAGLNEITAMGRQIKVLCDGNRWIVILQRFDGSEKFHTKNWAAFKQGIGSVESNKEFFLGLQNLYDLTSDRSYELRFELKDFDGIKKTAYYTDFSVGSEENAYRLDNLGIYSGDAGDSFSYHLGSGFTTLDKDNDAKAVGSCGEEYNSAGWFKSCMNANIMGRYIVGENSNFKEGMYWETFRGPEYSLKSVKMSIRVKC